MARGPLRGGTARRRPGRAAVAPRSRDRRPGRPRRRPGGRAGGRLRPGAALSEPAVPAGRGRRRSLRRRGGRLTGWWRGTRLVVGRELLVGFRRKSYRITVAVLLLGGVAVAVVPQ